ncbi:propanediol utilization protein [Pelagimonas varians]|uniref:GHMP kinase N-terminal domain-containing protein n=1 Tax=Pelagimonas varians TaxID=696760 RepID=A0A238K6P5_9RHOB|nr:propanediol utilization protein [Pelagimonas varians]PYG31818.1 threonine kinase [Pelagimonas varians]SMX38539.1 hypothetical protein PEV8663_01403 [Pelagimonas varians]
MLLKTTVNGHFGELLQGCLGPSGPVALVTLPCPALQLTALGHPARRLDLYSPQRVLSPQVARRFLTRLGRRDPLRIVLRSAMPPGGGAGASTAALVALARISGTQCDPQDLAEACLDIEGATDPLMFAQPERLLWASRQARILGNMPALPKFEVLGGFWGPMTRTAPQDRNFSDISDLIPQWRSAALAQDLASLSALCSQSANRNLSLRGLAQDPTPRLSSTLNALGYVVAHTGAARGFIFARGTCPKDAARLLRKTGYERIVHFNAGGGV